MQATACRCNHADNFILTTFLLMSKPVVTIGIPTGDYFTIVRPTAIDMMKMIAHTMNNKICEAVFVESAASPVTERNRNSLVGQMHESSEFLLQIDADMTFAPNTLERMLDTYKRIYEVEKKPFVLSGIGMMGSPPFFPAMFHAVNKGEKGFVRADPSTGEAYDGWVPVMDIPKEVFEVDAVGSFGFLIPFEMFSVFKGYGGWFNHHVEMDPDTPGKYLDIRHDIAFSMRVREAGHKIFVDPSIEFGHIRPRPVKKEVWEKSMMNEYETVGAKEKFCVEQFRARHLRTAFGWQIKHADADGLTPEQEKQLPINRTH